MEKKKLKLSYLKVQSFVTRLNEADARTIQGGGFTDGPQCTINPACVNTHAHICNYTCGNPLVIPGLPLCQCPESTACPETDPNFCL